MRTTLTIEQELSLQQIKLGVVEMSREDLQWSVINLWEVLQTQQNLYETQIARLKMLIEQSNSHL